MNNLLLILFVLYIITIPRFSHAQTTTQQLQREGEGEGEEEENKEASLSEGGRRVIEVQGGPESVIWAVQLSDLHFSVHHPDRALDFIKMVGPALSIINPSLVLLTGDLTDGKSEDLLTMKLNEEEWMEYQNVMDDVVSRSQLDPSIFFDLRGNHDNFGVPEVGGSFDFFSKYSINGQLGRKRNVNSVTLEGQRQIFLPLALPKKKPG